MLDQIAVQQMLDRLDETISSSQPLVLSHNNVASFNIQDVRIVYHNMRSEDSRVSQLVADGFEVLAVLVVRDDDINYGTAGAAAAVHKFVTALVKKK